MVNKAVEHGKKWQEGGRRATPAPDRLHDEWRAAWGRDTRGHASRRRTTPRHDDGGRTANLAADGQWTSMSRHGRERRQRASERDEIVSVQLRTRQCTTPAVRRRELMMNSVWAYG